MNAPAERQNLRASGPGCQLLHYEPRADLTPPRIHIRRGRGGPTRRRAAQVLADDPRGLDGNRSGAAGPDRPVDRARGDESPAEIVDERLQNSVPMSTTAKF